MRIIISLVVTGFLASCAVGKTYDYRSDQGELNGDNAALVVIGALSIPLKIGLRESELSGLSLTLTNVETGARFDNKSGLSGYPRQTLHAFWVPPGTYELSDVFFLDGAMHPIGGGPRVTLAKGDRVYLGTVSTSWSAPSWLDRSKYRGSGYDYSRESLCLIVAKCETDGRVYIYDYRSRMEQDIANYYPSIQADSIEIRLLAPP